MGGTYGWLGVSSAKNPGIFLEDRGFLENHTLPETNIAPENRPLEKEIPIENRNF